MQRVDSLENTLKLGKIEGKKRMEWQRMRWFRFHWLNGHEFEQTLGGGGGQRSLTFCSSWGCWVRHDLAREQGQQHIVSQVRESSAVHVSQLHFLPLQITNKNLGNQVGSHACPQGRAIHHMWLSPSGHFGLSWYTIAWEGPSLNI